MTVRMLKAWTVSKLEYMYAVIKHALPVSASPTAEKAVFIPFWGQIGDMVLFLDALNAYNRLYCKENGYILILGCRSENCALLKLLGYDERMTIIELTRERLARDFPYFIRKVHELQQYRLDKILQVRALHKVEDVFLYSLHATTKVAFLNTEKKPHGVVLRFIATHTYDKILYASPASDQFGRYGSLVRHLGETSYKSRLPRLSIAEETTREKQPYCVIAPGAAALNKCWPAARFAAVADYIVDHYGMDIVLSGSKADIGLSTAVHTAIRNKARISDMTGKTSMLQWTSLLKNAEIVISNDSGASHVAAGVRTQSICIASQQDGYRFFPYQIDAIEPGDKLPIPVRCERLPCFDCWLTPDREKHYGDPLCVESVKRFGVIKCVYDIATESVTDAIDALLRTDRAI